MYQIVIITILILFFSACDASKSKERTGYFIDSAVSGLEYQCAEIQGVTNSEGEFTYNDSCTVEFRIGGIIIGQIEGSDIYDDGKVLPADLLGLSRDNIEDETLVLLLRFLQTLDTDNNPNNNISFSEDYQRVFAHSTLDFTALMNNENELFGSLSLVNKRLISKEKALAHYKKTLEEKFDIEIESSFSLEKLENSVQNNEDSTTTSNQELLLTKKDNDIEISQTRENSEVVSESKSNEVLLTDVDEEENIIEMSYVFVSNINQSEDLIKTETETDLEVEIESSSTIEIAESEILVNEESVEEIKPHINDVTVSLETQEIEDIKEDTGFSYENQRDVTINISAQESVYNKQVLLYEEMSLTNTPVGDFEQLKNIIISSIFNENGELNLTYTLGNHITSVWLVVPFYGLTIEVPINNNMVYLKLNN